MVEYLHWEKKLQVFSRDPFHSIDFHMFHVRHWNLRICFILCKHASNPKQLFILLIHSSIFIPRPRCSVHFAISGRYPFVDASLRVSLQIAPDITSLNESILMASASVTALDSLNMVDAGEELSSSNHSTHWNCFFPTKKVSPALID
eukprot:Sdes_comp18914_c0_seq3m9369